jgi:hypothetical protein
LHSVWRLNYHCETECDGGTEDDEIENGKNYVEDELGIEWDWDTDEGPDLGACRYLLDRGRAFLFAPVGTWGLTHVIFRVYTYHWVQVSRGTRSLLTTIPSPGSKR